MQPAVLGFRQLRLLHRLLHALDVIESH
jgi:hypothetical protein